MKEWSTKKVLDLTAVKSSLIYTRHWGLFHYNSPCFTDFSYMIFDSFQMNSHVFFLCVWCIYFRIFVNFCLRVRVPYINLFYFIRSNNIHVNSLSIFKFFHYWALFLGHQNHSKGQEGPCMGLLFLLCLYVSKLWWKFNFFFSQT